MQLKDNTDSNISQKWHDPDWRHYSKYGSAREFTFSQTGNDPGDIQDQVNDSLPNKQQREAEAYTNAFLENSFNQKHSFTDAKEMAREMGRKLVDFAGLDRIGQKVQTCYDSGRINFYEENGQITTKYQPHEGCGYHKYCPFHAKSETKRKVKKYFGKVLETSKDYRLKFLTLTVQNPGQDELKEKGWNKLWDNFKKLRDSVLWSAVQAGIANFEITFNPDSNTYNPHLHILVAVDWYKGNDQTDFNYRKINKRWQKLTGATITNFKSIPWNEIERLVKYPDHQVTKSNPIIEVLKYPAPLKVNKGSQGIGLLDMPEWAFYEAVRVIYRQRTLRSYGDWYRLKKTDAEGKELEDQDQEDQDQDNRTLIATLNWYWNGERSQVNVILIQVYKSQFNQWLLPEIHKWKQGKEPPG